MAGSAYGGVHASTAFGSQLPSSPQPVFPLPPFLAPAVKILRGHEMVDFQGCLDVAFHPTQPWAFTAGADAMINLYVNP